MFKASKCLKTFAFENHRLHPLGGSVPVFVSPSLASLSLSLSLSPPLSLSLLRVSFASSTPNLSLPLLCSGSVAPTADSHNVRRRANCSSTPDPTPLRVPVATELARHSSQQLLPIHPHPATTLQHGHGEYRVQLHSTFSLFRSVRFRVLLRREVNTRPRFSRGFSHCLFEPAARLTPKLISGLFNCLIWAVRPLEVHRTPISNGIRWAE